MWVESKTYRGMLVNESGEVVSLWRGTWKGMRPFVGGKGYHYVNYPHMPTKRIKYKTVLLHRLIMDAFHGPSTCEVDHRDENKSNNKLSNLEYVSPEENKRRYWSKRSRPKGLSKQDVLDIVASDGIIIAGQLASRYGVSEALIDDILHGRKYQKLLR